MNKWSVERWAASSGLSFAVLLLVGVLLPGSPKKWNASAADVQSYLQGKHKEILIGGILFGVGYVLFLWFLASFAGFFRDAGQGRLATIMYGAGVAAVTIAAVGDGVTVALAKLTFADDTNTVRALYGMSNFLYGRFLWVLAALALATWLAVKRSKAMPDWYAWLSLLGAALFVLGGLSLKNHGFFSPTGGMAFIAFFGFIVWTAISSFGLVRKTA
ncbi:MAG TPA: hypothetical protein VFM96_12435 [Gaiellaceae bacterium]|nr:hypothetical protein [Gaiellaceae bacterium]